MRRIVGTGSRAIIACSLAIILAAGLGCAKQKLSRELMPTPVALTLNIPHPGGDFRDCSRCADEAIPVFVMSGRNVEDPNRKRDPFSNERAHVPMLGTAYVKVGEGLSPEELHEETISEKLRKRAKVVFKGFQLDETPLEVDPWRVKDNVVRYQGSPWVQAIRAQMELTKTRHVTIFVHGYNTEFMAAKAQWLVLNGRRRPGCWVTFKTREMPTTALVIFER